MFREMRRRPQLLGDEETLSIIENCSYGVLALIGDGGYPYTVPLNYVYSDGKIYFHGAKVGHKVDAVRSEERASFCVVDQDKVVAEEYTTYFRSVIAFGRARIVEDEEEKYRIVEMMAKKFYPDDTDENRKATIAKGFANVGVMELAIEHMTGKEHIKIIRAREAAKEEETAK